MKKIESALASECGANKHATEEQKIRALTEQLTDKEGEVMRLMIAGKTNREIAEICGNSNSDRRAAPGEDLRQARGI